MAITEAVFGRHRDCSLIAGGIMANQNGYWNYYYATPIGAEEDRSDTGSGLSSGAVAGVVVGAAALLIGLLWGVVRRGKTGADEREYLS